MNKKEQAAFEQMEAEAAKNRALRWSDYSEEPDMPSPLSGEYVNGWSFNSYTAISYPTWSTYGAHGSRKEGQIVDAKAHHDPNLGSSHHGIRQFSTKERALKAMRRSIERTFAEKLAAIDSLISQEQ